MQRRIDEPQRRLNNQFAPRLLPPGTPRFGEPTEVASSVPATGMPYPIGYQLNAQGPPGHHAGSVAASLGHPPVGLAAAGGPAPSLHTQTGPGHPAGLAANQALSGGPGAGAGQQQQQQQFQRLKVEDALSYLDQVKLQFGNQPQVYNDFLDIMKEFKSQTIDTPGVINRVSNLFKGHPDLIVGFNTFLPPGYKIEVQCETINVHQPGQQVMSIAALAQSQAMASGQRPKQGMSIWDVALASQASANQSKVGPPGVHHSTLATPAPTSASDHRSYHQSPRPQPDTTSNVGSTTSAAPSGGTAALGHQQAQTQQQSQSQGQQQQQPQGGQQQQSNNSQQQGQQPGGQPVEFNHAINYVNKIKNRFQGQPDIYKQFLEILHTYQKEQRLNRDQGGPGGPAKPLTESEVYQQVANLFKNQEDLLAEFGQFLPDANGGSSYGVASFVSTAESSLGVRNDHSSTVKKQPGFSSGKTQTSKSSTGVKRPANSTTSSTTSFLPPAKKKLPKDYVGLADAGKTGSLTEYAFFDKVRKALRIQEVYDNFLRTIVLFNQEIVTKQELVTLVSFFLSKFPDLFREFKDLLGVNEQGGGVEAVPHGAAQKERIGGELAMEIDFNTCKRYGASYRGIPSKFVAPKCSGRTALCKEVLNDTWVSFPTWSEDSSFVTSRKTQYEENIYKCEDERFELDYVIETNSSTIKCLEGVNKKLARMPQDEAAKFRLDNCLGGTSECINRYSIHRIYGDKANDIIDGLKKNPLVAVPLVIRRLKAKDEEWREAQKQFNKLWKEQNEKFYLKSLDHQCANFKQHDIKAIRGKSLLNQIEAIYDERADNEEAPPQGPMLSFTYDDRSLIEDAGGLIIHHVKRQTGVDKEAKTKIKVLVKHFVPDLFFAQRGELSDDDGEGNEDMDADDDEGSTNQRTSETSKRANKDKEKQSNGTPQSGAGDSADNKAAGKKKGGGASTINGVKKEPGDEGDDEKNEDMEMTMEDDDNDRYSLFYCNTTWYIFLRLHQILCTRLLKAYNLTQKLIQEDTNSKEQRSESVAKALRLRSPLDAEVQDYYSYFLDMVRAVLDGNLESSQYEDTMREMYGIDAYLLFTVDKLVQNIVRQVQHLIMDDMPSRLTTLFEEQREQGGAGGKWVTRHQRATLEHAYLRQAETILGDDNPFKFVIRSLTATMDIDMLDPPPEWPPSVKDTMAWSSYLKEYTATGDDGDEEEVKKEEFCHCVGNSRPIYLIRNKRRNPNWQEFKEKEEKGIKEEDCDITKSRDGEGRTGDHSSKGKGDGGDVEVKDEPKENEEDSQKSTSKRDKPTDGDKLSADASGDSKGDQSKTEEEVSKEKAEEASMMQDAATLASLSRGGRLLAEEEEEMDEDEGGKIAEGGGNDSDGGLGDDEEDDEEKDGGSGGKRRKIGTSPEGSARRTHCADNTSLKFNPNSYHHVFVNKTGLLMFQAKRLARTHACHKSVTQRKHANLSSWVQQWEVRSLTNQQREDSTKWMMGQARDTRANRTTARTIDRPDRTPYRAFTRYCVDWVAAMNASAPAQVTSTVSSAVGTGRSSPSVN